MTNSWRPSKNLLGGFRCVEHVITKELSLIGKYGEIWQYDSFNYRAIIYSARIARRFLPKNQWPQGGESETLIRFSTDDLGLWVKRMQIPAKPSSQAEIANGFKSNIEEPIGQILSLEAKNQSKMVSDTNPMPLKKSVSLTTRKENLGELAADEKFGESGGSS